LCSASPIFQVARASFVFPPGSLIIAMAVAFLAGYMHRFFSKSAFPLLSRGSDASKGVGALSADNHSPLSGDGVTFPFVTFPLRFPNAASLSRTPIIVFHSLWIRCRLVDNVPFFHFNSRRQLLTISIV